MTDYYVGIALLFLSLVMLSCSPSQQVAEAPDQAVEEAPSVYPGWFSASSDFVSTDSTFTAYGLAVGTDSAEAVQQAVTEAKANFEKNLSSRLESIREDALEELGENSSVTSSSFIFALRNAEASLADVVTVSRQSAKAKDGQSGYNGFAEATISKNDLVGYLENQLSTHRQAWSVLSSSQAFQDF